MDGPKTGAASKKLKKWNVLNNLDETLLKNVEYFVGFQTYTDDDTERKDSALFLTSDDEVYAVGHNNSDNLLALTGDDFGRSFTIDKPRKIHLLSGKRIKKMTVNERFGAALTIDGKMLYWGMDMKFIQYEERDMKYVKLPYEPQPDLEIADIACGAHSITAVTNSNEVHIWGCINLYYSAFYSFLKLPVRKSVKIQSASCGWYHVALLDQTGQVWTFGYGSVGQLGYKWSSQGNGYVNPVKVTLPGPCEKVECGAYSTLFLLKSGEVYACGSNSESDYLCVGASGYVFTPIKVQLDQRINDIAATYAWFSGKWQSLFAAHSEDSNKYFKWGDGTKKDQPAIENDVESLNELYVNFKTPQSLGSIQFAPSLESFVFPSDVSPAASVDPSIFKKWSIFDYCSDDFLARVDAFVVCNSVDRLFVTWLAFTLTEDGSIYSLGFNGRLKYLGLTGEAANVKFQESPVLVESLSMKGVKKIVKNWRHCIALTTDGKVFLWGEIGLPRIVEELKDKTVIDVDMGSSFWVFVLDNSEVFYTGELLLGHYAPQHHLKIEVPQNEKIVQVACGVEHCALLSSSGIVYTFGRGYYTQLGYVWKEKKDPSYTPKKVPLPGLCTKVVCGVISTLFLLENGDVYACGGNTVADNLGVGHDNIVATPERVQINEKVLDIAASKFLTASITDACIFAVKCASGTYYKWGFEMKIPEKVEGVNSLVEVFEELPIPHSLSLVRVKHQRVEEEDFGVQRVYNELEAKPNVFGDPLYSDVKIRLADSVLPAHKALLYRNSLFFRKMLATVQANSEEINLVADNPKAIKAHLKRVYGLTESYRTLTLQDLLALYELENGEHPSIRNATKDLMRKKLFDEVIRGYTTEHPSPLIEKILRIFTKEQLLGDSDVSVSMSLENDV